MTTLNNINFPFYIKIVTDKFAEKKHIKKIDIEKSNKRMELQAIVESIVTEIRVPKCKLEWDKNSFLPMPVIEEAEIILTKISNDKYSLCPKVTEIEYPSCMNLRQYKYCTKKICS